MTPDEIRKQWNVVGKFPPELIGDFALLEIAAQLAEMNQPRWVWFPLADGAKMLVRKDYITTIQRFGDNCVINDRWERRYMIFEPIEDVCRKLGIPMEEK